MYCTDGRTEKFVQCIYLVCSWILKSCIKLSSDFYLSKDICQKLPTDDEKREWLVACGVHKVNE